MSEQPYTPTTDEVRGDFVMLNESHHPPLTGPELGNAFDRWLAQERDKALDPVRRILDQLAGVTEPPCDRETWIEAYRQAVHDISIYVYPEATR